LRKTLLKILIVLLCIKSYAQQSYFNKRIAFGCGENGQKIIPNGNGYDLISSVNCLGNGLRSVFARLDSSGNLIFTKVHGMDYHHYFSGGYGGFIALEDSSYVFAGTITDSSGVRDALLYKLSNVGDSIWIKQYGDTSFQSGWEAKHVRDNGFILTGQTYSYGANGDAMILKTDSMGNEQWQQHYGGSYYDIAVSMDTCFDGGYIICGATTSFGVGVGSQFENGYIIKTDSAGNMQWSKALGGIYDDVFWNCKQSKNGSFVFAGGYTYNDPGYPNCCFSYSKPWIAKLDTAGDTIWDKKYGPVVFNTSLFSLKELANGDLIATGWVYDTTVNHQRGLIIRVTSQGDSLWYRVYENLHANNSQNYLYDISPTNDGGFIAIGFVVPVIPDTGVQNTWVLKIDSNGCEIANCLLSAEGKVVNYSNGLTIYPNPSTGVFNISHNYYEIETTEVYNCIGEKVFSREGSSEQIDLSKASLGVYFYCIKTRQGKFFKGRIVKE
jgi:hypothetical protein